MLITHHHETFHCLGKSHNHPPDAADSKQAIDKVKQMASTSQTTNHRIYCAVTGTLPPATMSRVPGEDAVKKIAQRARRKMNPRPRALVSLAVCYGCMLSLNLYVIYISVYLIHIAVYLILCKNNSKISLMCVTLSLPP